MAHDDLAIARRFQADLRALRKQYPELTAPGAQRRLEDYLEILAVEDTDMPPRGQRMMGEDTTPIAIRLPRSLVAKVDAHVKRMRREHPDLPITRTHALSNLIRRACEALAVEDAAPGVIFAEPVPAAEVEPAASPTMVENALAAIELATGQPIPRRRRVVSPLDQAIEEMPLEHPLDYGFEDMPAAPAKAARPKAAAKKRTTRTTKGRK